MTTSPLPSSVAVTGACGTVGSELVRQLLLTNVERVVCVDQAESELFFLGEQYRLDSRVDLSLADIRNKESLVRSLVGVQDVFHAAALKHVPLCEQSPMEAVETNIIGTQNVIEACVEVGAERLVFTSTDKAVNPTNVMGTSKLMAERLVSATLNRPGCLTAISTRFGNVLGSRGSVLPLFAQQIRDGGPVTLTSPEMTRFIMTLANAVELVLESANLGRPGEVFITKMPAVRICDLAETMVEILAPHFGRRPDSIEIVEVGPRPGEKLFEDLMNDEELRRSVDVGKYIVVRPMQEFNQSADRLGVAPSRPYNSSVAPPLSRSEIADFLTSTGLLGDIGISGANK